MARTQEFARYWRYPGLDGGVDLMRARFVRHRFARHSHDTYAIGMLEAGQEEIRFPDGTEYAGAGDLVLIEPGVVHTGVPRTGHGWSYRVLYPSAEQVRAVSGGLPSFGRRVVSDPRAARWVAAAHRAAESGESLAADVRLHEALAYVVRAYSTYEGRREREAGRGVADVREMLHLSLAHPPSLGELAAVAGMTPFAVLRAFRRAYGMPPHAYVTQLRVARARDLLRKGVAPAEAAAAVGFCDQSHLSRHFRNLVGVPPRAYQRGVQ
ncbi:MAG TPA: AraC family transcriptional regulator [Nonomuraea sp.]|nr:AraC family transcriptional regulator [Nonomuraea sp.]